MSERGRNCVCSGGVGCRGRGDNLLVVDPGQLDVRVNPSVLLRLAIIAVDRSRHSRLLCLLLCILRLLRRAGSLAGSTLRRDIEVWRAIGHNQLRRLQSVRAQRTCSLRLRLAVLTLGRRLASPSVQDGFTRQQWPPLPSIHPAEHSVGLL